MHPTITLCYLTLMIVFIGGFLFFACESLGQWRADRRAEREAFKAIDAIARDFFNR